MEHHNDTWTHGVKQSIEKCVSQPKVRDEHVRNLLQKYKIVLENCSVIEGYRVYSKYSIRVRQT